MRDPLHEEAAMADDTITAPAVEAEAPQIEALPADSAPADLGENGVKALQAERNARKAAEKQIADLAAQLDAIRVEQMTDQEKALAVARSEAAETAKVETAATYERRLLEATVKAQAAGRFRDPADALRLLDLTDIPRGDDGVIDDAAIGAALDQILSEKPYLGTDQTPSWPAGDQGPQGPEAARTFTRTQLRDPKFFQDNRDAIMLAQREGRITE
jgi:hypothetical protein